VPEYAKDLIKPWNEREGTEKYADSGVDDQVSSVFDIFILTQLNMQMIIHIPFTENVRLRSVLLKIGTSSPYLSILALIYGSKVEATSPPVICGYTLITTLSSILPMQRALILNSTSPYSRVKPV